MSRELKFRAWHKKHKRMSEVTSLFPRRKSLQCTFDRYTFDEVELMEYTGLKDITNTKIYEGDILEIGEQRRKVVVIFKDGCFGYKSDNCCISFKNQSPIVIGNIYENPELLKESEE